jgi:hypothetical protein
MLQEEFEDTKAVINFSSGRVAHGQWKLIRTSDFCQRGNQNP